MAVDAKEFFVWIDESGTPIPKAAEAGDPEATFSVGMLLRESSIDQAVITEALARLRADPEAQDNPADITTLGRGFFHACEDSKNAHSFICTTARNTEPSLFEFLSFDRTTNLADHDSMLRSGKNFHRSMVELLAARITASPVARLVITLARHATSFADDDAAAWWKSELVRKLISATADLPQLPTIFPEIDVKVSGPEVPGLQIVDFLLWAALRYERDKGDPWLVERAEYRFYTGWGYVDGPLRGKEYIRGKSIDDSLPPGSAFVRAPREDLSNDELADLLFTAERKLRSVVTDGLPPHAAHLKELVEAAVGPLRQEEPTLEDLDRFIKAYICLVDTVPLYDPEDSGDVGRAIDTKHILGIILLRRQIRWLKIARWWSAMRQKAAIENPGLLGLS